MQKLETLGQLTGGVAHDFNNLLTPVIGNLDMLRRQLPADAKQHRLIDVALQAASRAATLVQRLLAFARRQDLQARAVDIGALIEGMSDLLRRSIGPTVAVDVHSAPNLPAARVDPTSSSWRSSTWRSTRATRCVGRQDFDRNAAETVPPGQRLNPGDYVAFCMRHRHGNGRSYLAQAVEPFLSTKGMGKGRASACP